MSAQPSGPHIALRYAWLSVAAAVATIALKMWAWQVTGSVGLLSDAAESVVNLVAALVAVYAIWLSAKPADRNHHFGHSKAEYFSAAVEGQMIFVAACFIIYSAIDRLLHPAPLEALGVGIAISVVAAVLNGVVGFLLLRAARMHRSAALKADGHHLLTDVYTSIGVVVGVALVWLTGLTWLDPVIALIVGANIIVTGYKLLSESADGLMDISWPREDNEELARIIGAHQTTEIAFHGLRTREAGGRRFAQVHVLVPGHWAVARAHDVAHDVEQVVAERFGGAQLVCHVEPREDPRAYDDFDTEVPIEAPPK